MQKGEGNWLAASVPIKADGMYHIAAVEKSEDIRLSEDYFIEAQKEQPPKVKIARPARDFKVNPIEEVTVQVEAEDDFALQDVVLALFRERRSGEERLAAEAQRRQDVRRRNRCFRSKTSSLCPATWSHCMRAREMPGRRR